MKQISIKESVKRTIQQFASTVVILLFFFFTSVAYAQTDSTKATATEDKKESALITPAVQFISVQKGDSTIDLKAKLTSKVKGVFIKLPYLKVTFLQLTDTAEKILGFVITDRDGKAVYNVQANAVATDKEGKLHYKAVFAGNKAMEPAEEELTIKRALIILTPIKADSLFSVQAKLVDVGSGTVIAIPEAALGVFVKRSFNSLKVGEGTTDVNGEATIEIAGNLPGDDKGNITLQARLDENELYGNLETSVVQQWGVPVSVMQQKFPRSLWSTQPPLWMLITFIILIAVVWGHYLVIIFELFRLRKEQPKDVPIKSIL